nr:MAG TPA: hypothetical protein [Caudoviricetes sp.]
MLFQATTLTHPIISFNMLVSITFVNIDDIFSDWR